MTETRERSYDEDHKRKGGIDQNGDPILDGADLSEEQVDTLSDYIYLKKIGDISDKVFQVIKSAILTGKKEAVVDNRNSNGQGTVAKYNLKKDK